MKVKFFLPPSPAMPGEGRAFSVHATGSQHRERADRRTRGTDEALPRVAVSASSKREDADRYGRLTERCLTSAAVILYPAFVGPPTHAGSVDLRIEDDRMLLNDLVLLGKTASDGEVFWRTAEVVEAGPRRHVDACENGMFPVLEDAVSRADLVRLGNRVEVARGSARIRPHPGALMRPPGNKLTDAATGAVAKIRDLVHRRNTYLVEKPPTDAGTRVVASRAK